MEGGEGGCKKSRMSVTANPRSYLMAPSVTAMTLGRF
jgi:hypothetical protein